MKRIIAIAIPFALALAASVSGPSALAQGMSGSMGGGSMMGGGNMGGGSMGSPGYEVTAEMQRYREMAGLMRDMSQQMDKIQQGMAQGEMSPQRQQRMRQQLSEMSEIMYRMSGLADRPSMNDPEIRRQTEQMRRQMDNMIRE